MSGSEFVPLSLTPLIIGCLAAVACALPGNFLILRRQALIGDAISHVVLPGIVVAFLLTGAISATAMMLGAAVAAVTAVAMIEGIRCFGRIEAGAAMGVVFTAMFAGGVLLLELSDTSGVHLDVEHALYGNLESLIWLDATGWGSLLEIDALKGLPPELFRIAAVVVIIITLLAVFWRPLAISTFDEGFAATLGLPVTVISLGLVIASALAAVAAFDAVGSIIVIAMFICPPAAAHLMTNRLGAQIAWSVGFALASAIVGFVLAGYGPLWIGGTDAVSAAGMIATVSGVILAITAVAGPRRRAVT
ncbi:metal ABC transporter permease [Boseongicola aestuarii]|uniref:Manganese transport system membrane protein MntB n=1 Tax=Boseongicola aestuarii TaxID=1470561 RepID=A0A238J3L4_9RHOB|nr:metal ABC transporter permease [Boseongicola aestuarii]SMX24822.1 Manganese transport system membrane protein MntB [Boseongicola aestuarii]